MDAIASGDKAVWDRILDPTHHKNLLARSRVEGLMVDAAIEESA